MVAGVTYPDAAHTGTACPFDASSGVFHNDAPLWRHANARSRSQIHGRIRVSFGHILGGYDTLKTMGRSECIRDHLDIQSRRRRGDSLKPPLLMKLLDPTGNPGER